MKFTTEDWQQLYSISRRVIISSASQQYPIAPPEHIQLASIEASLSNVRKIGLELLCEKAMERLIELDPTYLRYLHKPSRKLQRLACRKYNGEDWQRLIKDIGKDISPEEYPEIARAILEYLISHCRQEKELKTLANMNKRDFQTRELRDETLLICLSQIPPSDWEKYQTMATVRLFELSGGE